MREERAAVFRWLILVRQYFDIAENTTSTEQLEKSTKRQNRESLPKNMLKATEHFYHDSHLLALSPQTEKISLTTSKQARSPSRSAFKWPPLTSLVAPFHPTIEVW